MTEIGYPVMINAAGSTMEPRASCLRCRGDVAVAPNGRLRRHKATWEAGPADRWRSTYDEHGRQWVYDWCPWWDGERPRIHPRWRVVAS